MTQMCDAWDKTSGDKLPNPVPDTWFAMFPNLSRTDPAEAADPDGGPGAATEATAPVVTPSTTTSKPASTATTKGK